MKEIVSKASESKKEKVQIKDEGDKYLAIEELNK